jgi:repA
MVMKNKIVKYDNDFNTVGLRGFTAEELDLLMTILHRVRNREIEEIKFSYYDLKQLIKSEKKPTIEQFSKSIMNINKKLLALNFTLVENDEIIQFALFKEFRTSPKKQILTVSVSERFKFLLNDFDPGKWTRFELEEFVDLKSSYTKEFYRRMKQFRSTGFWKCGIEEFRNLLDIPEKYRITDIDAWVLKPIQKELGEKYNLKIEKKYGFSGGRGRSRVTGFEFKFSTEKKVDIVVDNEEEDNPIPLSKPRKQKKKEEIKVVPEIKSKIIEAILKQEKEKTLREKIKAKLEDNNMEIVKLKAMYEGLKGNVQLKKMTDQYPGKIQKIKDINMQLEAIFEADEENLTQEIIELAEELLVSKV